MSRAHRPRIVVAGQNARLLRLMHHKLGRAGFHVLPASDGEAALDLIYGYDPRLCVLDAALRCEAAGRSCARCVTPAITT